MLFYASGTYAEHTWSTYHWERTSNSFTIPVIDSVTIYWQGELEAALDEWDNSKVLDTLNFVSSDDSKKTRKRCKMRAGHIRVCNADYGYNLWLGMASIGVKDGHIVQGTAKINTSYSSYWASLNERHHVMCQEIGHLFGLGHTSTDGTSQGTCMDYSDASVHPASMSPNTHDYEMLEVIYSDLDTDAIDEPTDTCNAPRGRRGCNKNNNAGVGSGSDGPPPMGVRVHKGQYEEIWVAPRSDGGIWIHHIRLVPDEFRIIR